MRGSDVGMTVNAIVSKVEELLAGGGHPRAERLTDLLRRLLDQKESLNKHVRRLGRRPDVAFYLAVGAVKTKRIDVDVRIVGQSCGTIRLDSGTDRLFKPKNHTNLWGGSPEPLEWRDPRVRKYLDDAAKWIKQKQREATVESAFLVELGRSRSIEKQRFLWHHQPVHLGRLPFQFPLPISAHGAEPCLPKRTSAGHSDVIARRSGGRLRVFEVKKPGARDAIHALAQAVAYAATLRLLLVKWPRIYLPMLGYSPTHASPRIDAVALVDDRDRKRARQAAEHLLSENGHFDLYVMGYTFSGGRPLVITGEDAVGSAER